MELEITLLLFYEPLTLTLLLMITLILIYKLSNPTKYHPPPSPGAALPFVGHLHLLKRPPHRNFHRLAQITGPIFSLKIGSRRIVVVSSPSLVQECFTKNDVALAGRPLFLIDKYIGYNHLTLLGAPYGDHWRRVRRATTQELLSAAPLHRFLHIRSDEIKRLLLGLSRHQGFCKVEMRPRLTELTFNGVMGMIAGKWRLSSEDEDMCRETVKDIFVVSRKENPNDFFPFLEWVDYRGYKKKLASLGKKMDDFLQRLVDEHRHRHEKSNTIIGHLLTLQESQPHFYSDKTIKATILGSLLAGTDTTSATIEWAMSILLNHPRVLEKARAELETKIGLDRLMNEEDLPNLPYLECIIWETLRLFPAGPLLLPHEASKDCKVGGYDIPRDTILLVNVWAMHRDPELWEDATSFKPERFEGNEEVETYKLMPFGMGRRVCPGAGLAQRVVGMAVGSLIQCFEWKRVGLEEIDLAEKGGVTMAKLKPLEAMCMPRQITHNLLLQPN